jgi:hypothetical protein
MDLNELKAIAELIKPERPKPQSLFGIPQNLAIVVVLIIGILVYWNDNRGKSEFEVDLASDIKVLKTDVTSLKQDVSDIKSAKDADRQFIHGLSGNLYTREDHYEYSRTQGVIDQKQWDAIEDLRRQLKERE